MLLALVVIQLLLLAVLCFGDIGFDLRGRYGLSIEDGIAIFGIYLFVLIAGVVLAMKRKRWWITSLQVLIPIVLVVSLAIRASIPSPHYVASEYQYLIGQPKRQVESTLSSRNTSSGFESGPDGEFEFTTYRGMTVYYGMDGVVEKVVENDQ